MLKSSKRSGLQIASFVQIAHAEVCKVSRYVGIAATITLMVWLFTAVPSHADTFQYSVVDTINSVSFTFTVTETSLASSGVVTTGFSNVSVPAGDTLAGFAWNSAAGGTCFGASSPGSACADYQLNVSGGGGETVTGAFSSGSFLSPGTYTSTTNGSSYTVTITDLTAVPEPSSVMLLGSGALGLVGVIRRKLRV